MTPLEFLARLSAIVPPPRYPLVRYHGVLGPRSRWRALVVPRPQRTHVRKPAGPLSPPSDHGERTREPRPTSSVVREPPPRLRAETDPSTYLVPNVITVRHWDRLLDGELLATEPRVDWARLMRRTYRST